MSDVSWMWPSGPAYYNPTVNTGVPALPSSPITPSYTQANNAAIGGYNQAVLNNITSNFGAKTGYESLPTPSYVMPSADPVINNNNNLTNENLATGYNISNQLKTSNQAQIDNAIAAILSSSSWPSSGGSSVFDTGTSAVPYTSGYEGTKGTYGATDFVPFSYTPSTSNTYNPSSYSAPASSYSAPSSDFNSRFYYNNATATPTYTAPSYGQQSVFDTGTSSTDFLGLNPFSKASYTNTYPTSTAAPSSFSDRFTYSTPTASTDSPDADFNSRFYYNKATATPNYYGGTSSYAPTSSTSVYAQPSDSFASRWSFPNPEAPTGAETNFGTKSAINYTGGPFQTAGTSANTYAVPNATGYGTVGAPGSGFKSTYTPNFNDTFSQVGSQDSPDQDFNSRFYYKGATATPTYSATPAYATPAANQTSSYAPDSDFSGRFYYNNAASTPTYAGGTSSYAPTSSTSYYGMKDGFFPNPDNPTGEETNFGNRFYYNNATSQASPYTGSQYSSTPIFDETFKQFGITPESQAVDTMRSFNGVGTGVPAYNVPSFEGTKYSGTPSSDMPDQDFNSRFYFGKSPTFNDRYAVPSTETYNTQSASSPSMADYQSPANDYSTFQQGYTTKDGYTFQPASGKWTGEPDDVLFNAIANIESGYNPNLHTAGSKYKGLYQMSDREFKNYGGEGSIYDPVQNSLSAYNKMTAENQELSNKLGGRELTPTEQYMAHQQGVTGTYAHLSNPSGVAWQNVRPYYSSDAEAQRAIWKNMTPTMQAQYGSVNNVTSGNFLKAWENRVNTMMNNTGLSQDWAQPAINNWVNGTKAGAR